MLAAEASYGFFIVQEVKFAAEAVAFPWFTFFPRERSCATLRIAIVRSTSPTRRSNDPGVPL
jgi:hypothetical protein